MILVGKKGRNTVQAVVIFRDFMNEAMWTRRMRHKERQKRKAEGLGRNAKDMRCKAKETHVVCKEVGVRKREQVAQGDAGKIYREVLRRELG